MKTKKRTFWSFREYETEAISQYLERMAAKGWRLTKITASNSFLFEKGEAERLHFCAAVVPGSSEWDSESREEVLQYQDYCRESGWTPVCGNHLWQIFESREASPVPIETDPALQLATLREVIFRPARLAGLTVLSSLFLILLVLLWTEPIRTLASFTRLFSSLALIFAIVVTAGEFLLSWLWYGRAKRSLPASFLPRTSFSSVQVRTILQFAALGMLMLLLFLQDGLPFLVHFAIVFSGILLAQRILKEIRERDEGTRGQKAVTYVVVSFVAIFLMQMALNGLSQRILSDREDARFASAENCGWAQMLTGLDYRLSDSFLSEEKSPLALYQKGGATLLDSRGSDSFLNVTRYRTIPPFTVSSAVRSLYPAPSIQENGWNIEEGFRQTRDGVTVIRCDFTAPSSWDPDRSFSDSRRTQYIAFTDRDVLSISIGAGADERITEALFTLDFSS